MEFQVEGLSSPASIHVDPLLATATRGSARSATGWAHSVCAGKDLVEHALEDLDGENDVLEFVDALVQLWHPNLASHVLQRAFVRAQGSPTGSTGETALRVQVRHGWWNSLPSVQQSATGAEGDVAAMNLQSAHALASAPVLDSLSLDVAVRRAAFEHDLEGSLMLLERCRARRCPAPPEFFTALLQLCVAEDNPDLLMSVLDHMWNDWRAAFSYEQLSVVAAVARPYVTSFETSLVLGSHLSSMGYRTPPHLVLVLVSSIRSARQLDSFTAFLASSRLRRARLPANVRIMLALAAVRSSTTLSHAMSAVLDDSNAGRSSTLLRQCSILAPLACSAADVRELLWRGWLSSSVIDEPEKSYACPSVFFESLRERLGALESRTRLGAVSSSSTASSNEEERLEILKCIEEVLRAQRAEFARVGGTAQARGDNVVISNERPREIGRTAFAEGDVLDILRNGA